MQPDGTTRHLLGPGDPTVATNGFALLTYDKRGVGDSGGEYFGVGPANAASGLGLLADDVLAGVEALAARADIRADAIGILVPNGGAQSMDLVYHRVEVNVTERGAQTKVTQEFENKTGRPTNACAFFTVSMSIKVQNRNYLYVYSRYYLYGTHT